MASNFKEWQLQLVNERTGLAIDDDAGTYNVLTQNDPSEVTLYSDENGTSQANPGTMSNGVIRFFADSATTTVDISVLTSNGHAYFLEDITQSQHRICVLPEKMENTLIIPYQVVGASELIIDTGFDILSNMLIKDVFLHVTTLGTGANLDIGTSTDSDGFADGVTVDATGFPTALLNEVLTSAHQFGALLSIALTAAYVRKLHVRANATSGANIVYTNTTSCSTAGEGYIYVIYNRVPA